MGRRLIRAFLAFALLIPASVFGADSGVSYEDYKLKKNKYESAKDTVKPFEKRAGQSGSTYERLKAQRQLEMARKALRKAQLDFERVKAKIKPGDKAFEEETRFKGDPDKVGQVGPAGPVDPLKAVYGRSEQTRGGSSGEVVYNKPRDPANIKRPRMDASRWKIRQKPAPAAATPPPEEPKQAELSVPDDGQYLLDPSQLGRMGRKRRDVGTPLQGVDFVKKATEFRFRPFDYEGKIRRGEMRRETFEERRLIKSATAAMKRRSYQTALSETESLERMRPKDPRVFHLKAMILNRMKRFEEAEKAAGIALGLGMDGPQVLESLAWALLQQGKLKEAVLFASKAIEQDPSRSTAYMIRAYAHERMGDGEATQRDAAAAAVRSPAKFSAVAKRVKAGGVIASPSLPATALILEDGTPPVEENKGPPWALIVGGIISVACAVGGVFLLRKKS